MLDDFAHSSYPPGMLRCIGTTCHRHSTRQVGLPRPASTAMYHNNKTRRFIGKVFVAKAVLILRPSLVTDPLAGSFSTSELATTDV